jgi:SAM-dependent methyltransferase
LLASSALIKTPFRSIVQRRGIDVHLRSAPQLVQYRAIARRLATDGAGRLLDWGCGFGQVARLLKDEGIDVTPFDYRPDLAEETVAPLERYPDLEAHLSPDPVKLPFGDGSFDSVLSCGVLEHVQDPEGSVEEIARVLRRGGTFYVYNLPNRYSYLERIARLLGLYYHGQLPDDRVYTRSTSTGLLERHGFVVEEFRRANMLPLTLTGRLATQAAGAIWRTSRTLDRVPGLNIFATSLELVAVSNR